MNEIVNNLRYAVVTVIADNKTAEIKVKLGLKTNTYKTIKMIISKTKEPINIRIYNRTIQVILKLNI